MRLAPWIAGVAVVGLLVWAFRPVPVAVETALIAPQDFDVSVEEEGVARIRDVYTVSAPIAGRLERIALKPGDAVVAGQTVVARIGPADPALLDARARAVAVATVQAAEAAVQLARAQLDQAQGSADFAQAESARMATLFDRAAVSRRMLDAAVTEAHTATAAVASAEASLAVRERELDSARAALDAGVQPAGACCTEIRAPVSGRVLRVLVPSEQVVAPGMALLEIGNPGEIEVVTNLLSRDAVRVAMGAGAEVIGWGGPALAARVRRISPSAETRVSALGIEEQRVEVLLDPDPASGDWQRLGHGYRVILRIRLWQGRGVLAVPVAALFRDGADWAVFVAQDGRAVLRRIELGERNADFAEVLGGLKAGEVVILRPGDTVAEGTRLTTAD